MTPEPPCAPARLSKLFNAERMAGSLARPCARARSHSEGRTMHKHLLLIASTAVAGLAVFASPAAAQQKTVKACEAEWRANKAANQAAGVTEKAYVEKCRAGTAAAQPAPAPAPAAAPPSRTTTTPPPASTSRPSQPAAPAPSASPAQAPARAPAAGQPAGANQYAAEAQAKARCPSDTVVWVNLDSKIYHYSSNRNYGQTKSGAYMCEKDTAAAGFRTAKNEKRP